MRTSWLIGLGGRPVSSVGLSHLGSLVPGFATTFLTLLFAVASLAAGGCLDALDAPERAPDALERALQPPALQRGRAGEVLQRSTPAELAYHVREAATGYVLYNPAQRLSATFAGGQLSLQSDTARWAATVRWSGIGREDRMVRPAPPRAVQVVSNRLELEHGQDRAWFVNDPRGLEHGFVIAARPEGDGWLRVDVEISGSLRPRLAEDGQRVELVAPNGAIALHYSGLLAADQRGQSLPVGLAVEGQVIQLLVDDREAVYPLEIDPLVWSEVVRLEASDAADNARYGGRLDIAGDWLVVAGASLPWVRSRDTGGVGTWGEVAQLVSSDHVADDLFGSSVAISGGVIVVGAPHESSAASSAGAAYVFEFDGTTWVERKKLVASDPEFADYFGTDVAVSGDRIVVGAPNDRSPLYNRGAAYIFERDAGGADAWGEVKKVVGKTTDSGDDAQFGAAVAVDGDLVVVGAPKDNGSENEAGAAYVFERDLGGADNWGLSTSRRAPDKYYYDYFGQAVAVSGLTVVVGAPGKDIVPAGAGQLAGAAYVFERDSTQVGLWGATTKLVAANAREYDNFGGSVAIDGEVILVGAAGRDDAANNAGAAYRHERNAGGTNRWGQVLRATASDASASDWLGVSVSLSGQTGALAATGVDAAGTDRGAVYLWEPVFKADNGASCAVGSDCLSSFCVDAVCCDQACGGDDVTDDCLVCSVAAGAAVDGTCVYTHQAPCSDGDFCNGTETCTYSVCGSSTGDPCPSADGDSDCAESCDEALDVCAAPDPDGVACDDGAYCNGTETCTSGACAGSTGDPCAGPDGDDDCAESCDETQDACSAADPDGSLCPDALFCNGAETCVAGACVSPGTPCPGPDGDVDCAETCDEDADDCAAPDPDSSACDDGTYCNGSEACSGGQCVGPSSGDPCPGSDGDADCAESCDEDARGCSAPDPNGAACSNGSFCDGVEQCASGACVGSSGDPCAGPDGDGDCAESCDEDADQCAAPDPDASPCDDGLYCTVSDLCTAGACGGEARVCATGDACYEGTCDEGADRCDGAAVPDGTACVDGDTCTKGDTCAAGLCAGEAYGCDDDNPCTDDTCVGDGTCDHTPSTEACDDHDPCTTDDVCQQGACVGVGSCSDPDADVADVADVEVGTDATTGGLDPAPAELGDGAQHSKSGCGCRVLTRPPRPASALAVIAILVLGVLVFLNRAMAEVSARGRPGPPLPLRRGRGQVHG